MSSDPPLSMEPWCINPSWIMPINIKTVLMLLPRGFLQDFSYICIAKAKDFAGKHVNIDSYHLFNSQTKLIEEYFFPFFAGVQSCFEFNECG